MRNPMKHLILLSLPCVVQLFADDAPKRTGRFLSVHYGKPEIRSVADAAVHVDMMLFSANVQQTVPVIVREANPKIRCLGYLNVLDLYSEDPTWKPRWALISSHDAWFLRDGDGERVLTYLDDGYCTRYAIDRTNPEVQQFLAERAKQIVGGGYDGVLLDNFDLSFSFRNRKKFSGIPTGMTNGRWQKGGQTLLTTVKQAVGSDKLVIFNGLHDSSSTERRPYQTDGVSPFDAVLQYAGVADGGVWEGYFGWTQELVLSEERLLNVARTLTAYHQRGRITVAIARGESERDAEARFCLYLLTADSEHSYFSYVPNYKRIQWYPIFDVNIGRPVAEFTLRSGVAMRRFEKGLVVVNTTGQATRVALPGSYRSKSGKSSNVVVLEAKTGTILFTQASQ